MYVAYLNTRMCFINSGKMNTIEIPTPKILPTIVRVIGNPITHHFTPRGTRGSENPIHCYNPEHMEKRDQIVWDATVIPKLVTQYLSK